MDDGVLQRERTTSELQVGRRAGIALLVIVGLAVVMGLPTLRGTFVGADDYRLVLHHVLVNHPSLDHALQLLRIVHRDLYQPLPLLSFSAEFYLAGRLGLFDQGVAGGAWLFHLTNVVLHAVNAVLVFGVVRALHRRESPAGRLLLPDCLPGARPEDVGRLPTPRSGSSAEALGVASIAGVLYAVHPLQVEVVAWINGRMMLLSTLFALASVLSLSRWSDTGKTRWALGTVLFVLASAISKIRVGLPVLLLLVLFAHRRRASLRFAVLWLICAGLTACFAWINWEATAEAGMFEGAVRNLHGPATVRALLALAWYFEHFLLPRGLASWYPTPGLVAWTNPSTLRALAIVAVSLALIGWAAWRARPCACGLIWFFATIASTVQLVPTRNALAADRYMYLPIVGLIWIVALGLWEGWRRIAVPLRPVAVRAGAVCLAATAVVLSLAVSWHTAWFYESAVRKGRRIADLFPAVPHVWERVAWTYHNEGDYVEAIACAEREFSHDDLLAQSAAHQVIGMSQLRLGRVDEALASLHRAMDINPESSQARYNLAKALEELERFDEAIRLYEESIADAPLANPRMLRLAGLYRRMGRAKEARPLYESVLVNNPYDVTATMGLAELDIAVATPASHEAARRRLLQLLDWMPENLDARVNLGVVCKVQGRIDEAIEAYTTVLHAQPGHATAAFNLGALYYELGDPNAAAEWFERVIAAQTASVEQARLIHDSMLAVQRPGQCVTLWLSVVRRFPEVREARRYLMWARAVSGDFPAAEREARALTPEATSDPLAVAVLALSAVMGSDYSAAVARVEELSSPGADAADARDQLRKTLGGVLLQRPDDPWVFCLAARLWLADGREREARAFLDLCAQHCTTPSCEDYLAAQRARLRDAAPG